jgi:ketosteroid isomerase-like protein
MIMPSSRTTAESILRRYQQAMIDKSADDLAALYAADAVHELPFLFPGMPDRLDGREQIRNTYRAAWDASDARPTQIRQLAVHSCENDTVLVVEQVVVGVRESTGDAFEFPGVLILRLRDGKIIHARDYLDGLAVARAMGQLTDVADALS